MESTMSWVDFIDLILGTCTAQPSSAQLRRPPGVIVHSPERATGVCDPRCGSRRAEPVWHAVRACGPRPDRPRTERSHDEKGRF